MSFERSLIEYLFHTKRYDIFSICAILFFVLDCAKF